MTNRICPNDEILATYISGDIGTEDRARLEKHLLECDHCRGMVFDAHEILKKKSIKMMLKTFLAYLYKNKSLIISIIALVLSFFINKNFFQFIAVFLVFGIRWIQKDKKISFQMFIKEAQKNFFSKK